MKRKKTLGVCVCVFGRASENEQFNQQRMKKEEEEEE